MPPRKVSKVELYAAIRRDARTGLNNRQLQLKHRVGWTTVQTALNSAWPEPRKSYPKRTSKLDGFKPAIDEMLRYDLDAPRKQKHTITRIYHRLRDEHGMTDVSYPTVRAYVAQRRPQIRVEAGRGPAQVFIPQAHRPGAEAEVDFGEVVINLRGAPTTVYLFAFRLSFSGKAIHRAFVSGGFEAFFEGHVHALETLGGVPFGKVRYDNLKAAVAQVIGFSRLRREADRWLAFRETWGVDPFYCQPGIDGAHEKGGVEGDIGRFRRNHMVPVPDVASIEELNALIESWDIADDDRRIGARPHTVGEHFAIERPLLKPLPSERFETGRWSHPRVDRYSMIAVQTNKYSVPVRLIGRTVAVLLNANTVEVYDNQTLVAEHERYSGKCGTRVDLDHYLEGLLRKPGALPGSTALEQARAAGKFTPTHDAWWAAACKIHGDRDGTRELIEVLLLHRHLPHAQVVTGITAALKSGALTADAVALEARRIVEQCSRPAVDLTDFDTAATGTTAVASLTQRRLADPSAVIAGLPPDRRPQPSVTKYDQLLRLRPIAQEGRPTP
ncbi:IS21 family transposase [Antrihabitans stalactiti]|uniref:IS21 family transposase n=1 Tax=Antrihabitans stalactiti TaxID=2584121 RepID=A0A848KLF3_9NOCA|nr:IS21 family transposase [Antrihabitans stalactiti]NMN99021.1 IS21 family transposase [Antrihabitans stalactiti]